MSNVINLNTARKKKQRAEQDKTAEENRVKFGRTKADKALSSKNRVLADKTLDGMKNNDE